MQRNSALHNFFVSVQQLLSSPRWRHKSLRLIQRGGDHPNTPSTNARITVPSSTFSLFQNYLASFSFFLCKNGDWKQHHFSHFEKHHRKSGYFSCSWWKVRKSLNTVERHCIFYGLTTNTSKQKINFAGKCACPVDPSSTETLCVAFCPQLDLMLNSVSRWFNSSCNSLEEHQMLNTPGDSKSFCIRWSFQLLWNIKMKFIQFKA